MIVGGRMGESRKLWQDAREITSVSDYSKLIRELITRLLLQFTESTTFDSRHSLESESNFTQQQILDLQPSVVWLAKT